MEPRIQYATTSDGVKVAYWSIGEGVPVVLASSPPFSHIQLEWEWPAARGTFESVARTRRAIRFDWRGCGLSDRDTIDFSLEANVRDLSAVIDRLALERVVLIATIDAGPAAIAYAAQNPARVSHLILWGTYARGGFGDNERVRALFDLAQRDWQLFGDTVAHTMFGWSSSENAPWLARLFSESTTPAALKAAWEESFEFDVTDLLPKVEAPTLVIHPARVSWVDIDQSRLLASRIPNARLRIIEDQAGVLLYDEGGDNVRAMEEFIRETEEAEDPRAALPEGMTAILFADIADSTALTERLGDAAFREKARELDGILRGILRDRSGTPIEGKLLGDGVLAVFTSARQAIEAALACGRVGDEGGLPLHLGLHAGDVIREENNVYGGAVNIASRISGLSAPGEVLVSETVRSLARTSAGVRFEDRGEQALKGVGEPLRVWAVREGSV